MPVGLWSSPTFSGTRPPPCSHFTFTAINNHQALLFGGRQESNKKGRTNDVYLIDFLTMVCFSLAIFIYTAIGNWIGGWGAIVVQKLEYTDLEEII